MFDLQLDPFEIHDVSRDPKYQSELQRMRFALDAWLAHVDDWSEEPESAMVARFEPDGERQVTPAPTLSVRDGLLVVTPEGNGHSIEYRVDDGDWQLYVGPVSVDNNLDIEARAVRYGWEESEIVSGP
ncbi:MAG: hypothetical protein IPG64_25525 [Haliea sp.]|nr:hypothetical protein [Haliea sp.]